MAILYVWRTFTKHSILSIPSKFTPTLPGEVLANILKSSRISVQENLKMQLQHIIDFKILRLMKYLFIILTWDSCGKWQRCQIICKTSFEAEATFIFIDCIFDAFEDSRREAGNFYGWGEVKQLIKMSNEILGSKYSLNARMRWRWHLFSYCFILHLYSPPYLQRPWLCLSLCIFAADDF